MTVSGLEFLLLALAGSAIFFYIPTAGLRRAFIALCNAGFLYMLIPNGPTWAMLAAFLLTGYAVGCVLRARRSAWILTAYLIVMIAAFVWLKEYAFLHFILPVRLLNNPFAIVGLSYMLFRQIHFLVDAMQEQIEELSLWSYLNYQLNLFMILSGPIQRYQDFMENWNAMEPIIADTSELLNAYFRIFFGVIKITLLAAWCIHYYQTSMAKLDSGAHGEFALTPLFAIREFATAFYLYPAYVYFNFSGYCDIVIAFGALVGLKMPENFDKPFLSRNMIDFWTRQHKTLSFFIRDYLFTPMYKGIAENWPTYAPRLAFLCYFVAFLLAGIWHGSTLNFVIFGLLHGAGVSVCKLWENHLIKRRGRAGYKEYLQSKLVRVMAIALTVNFVCFTFVFFTPDVGRKLFVMHAVLKTVL